MYSVEGCGKFRRGKWVPKSHGLHVKDEAKLSVNAMLFDPDPQFFSVLLVAY